MHCCFGKEEIAKIAENFLINGNQNESTLEHGEEIDGVSVIESWIKEGESDKSADYGFGDLPVGTWFVKIRIHDEALWQKIKSGEVRGLSIEGLFGHELVENAMVKMRAQSQEAKAQNVLNAIRDIIQDDIDEAVDAEVLLSMMKGIIKKDGRLRGGKKVELESYNDYPSGVVNNAKSAVELKWDGVTDATALLLSGQGFFDFRTAGNEIPNNATTPNGDVLLSTKNFANGDNYSLVIEFR